MRLPLSSPVQLSSFPLKPQTCLFRKPQTCLCRNQRSNPKTFKRQLSALRAACLSSAAPGIFPWTSAGRGQIPDPRSEACGRVFVGSICLFRALENVTYLSVVESLLTPQREMTHSLSTRLLAAIYVFCSSLFRPMENLTYVPVVRDSL